MVGRSPGRNCVSIGTDLAEYRENTWNSEISFGFNEESFNRCLLQIIFNLIYSLICFLALKLKKYSINRPISQQTRDVDPMLF